MASFYYISINYNINFKSMSYITLNNNLPGIIGLMTQYPTTAKALNALAETLLRGENTLTMGERELIAAYVSNKNECNFCYSSHAAVAAYHLQDEYRIVDAIIEDKEEAPISEKMKSLLGIAHKVQQGGKAVSKEDIQKAKNHDATDDEIHTTVLIASAFCMFNRYVDGLSTWSPSGKENYNSMGKNLAEQGYINSIG